MLVVSPTEILPSGVCGALSSDTLNVCHSWHATIDISTTVVTRNIIFIGVSILLHPISARCLTLIFWYVLFWGISWSHNFDLWHAEVRRSRGSYHLEWEVKGSADCQELSSAYVDCVRLQISLTGRLSSLYGLHSICIKINTWLAHWISDLTERVRDDVPVSITLYNVGPTSKTFGRRCINYKHSKHKNICIIFIQCWTNVEGDKL